MPGGLPTVDSTSRQLRSRLARSRVLAGKAGGNRLSGATARTSASAPTAG